MGEQPHLIPIPPNLRLWPGCRLSFVALDATTEAFVSGVTVRRVSLTVDQTEGDAGDLDFGPFMLVTGPEG